MLHSTPLMMSVSLATATGLRGGVPLLLTATFARTGQIPIHPHFAFLTTNTAIAILLLATLIEIGADFIPGINHTFDVLHTLIRPAAATLIVASLLVEMPPIVGIAIGMIIGASICGFVHTVKTAGRVVISAATFGLANVLLSLLENVVAGLLTLFALIAPGMVFVLTLAFLIILMFVARRLWKRVRRGATHVKASVAGLLSPAKKRVSPTINGVEKPFFDDPEPF